MTILKQASVSCAASALNRIVENADFKEDGLRAPRGINSQETSGKTSSTSWLSWGEARLRYHWDATLAGLDLDSVTVRRRSLRRSGIKFSKRASGATTRLWDRGASPLRRFHSQSERGSGFNSATRDDLGPFLMVASKNSQTVLSHPNLHELIPQPPARGHYAREDVRAAGTRSSSAGVGLSGGAETQGTPTS